MFIYRHQFYLHARMELTEGNFVIKDLKMAIHVCALAAQAETGDAAGSFGQTEIYLDCLAGLVWCCPSENNFSADQQSHQLLSTLRPHHSSRAFQFSSHSSFRFGSSQQNVAERASFLPPEMSREEFVARVVQHHQTLKVFNGITNFLRLLKS